jgi:hypothetical protein
MSDKRKHPPNHDPFGPRWVGHGPSNISDAEAKERFRQWCKAGGRIGLFYYLFPGDRPPGWTTEATQQEERGRKKEGRGGR